MIEAILESLKQIGLVIGLVWVSLFSSQEFANPYISSSDQKTATDSAVPIPPESMAEPLKVVAVLPSSQPSSLANRDQFDNQSNSSIQVENYQLEAHPNGEEGHYIMRNAPKETMSTVEELNQAMNNYRRSHNLSELFIDPQMCQIAAQRAEEANQHFSHDEFKAHVENGDYDYTGFTQIGENLFDGSFSGVHIVEFGWDQSPSHRPNMHRDWTRGCGGVFASTAVFIFAK